MDTLARIRQLAAKEFSINPDGLDPAAPLDTLGIDSLSFIEFMFKVEEEFGVERVGRGPEGDQDARRPRAPRRRRADRRRQGLTRRHGRAPRRRHRSGRGLAPRHHPGGISALARRRSLLASAGSRRSSPSARACRWRATLDWNPAPHLQGGRGGEPRPRLAVRARGCCAGDRGQRPGNRQPEPRPDRRVVGHRHGRRAHPGDELQAGLRRRRMARAAAHRGHEHEQRRGLEHRRASRAARAVRQLLDRVLLLGDGARRSDARDCCRARRRHDRRRLRGAAHARRPGRVAGAAHTRARRPGRRRGELQALRQAPRRAGARRGRGGVRAGGRIARPRARRAHPRPAHRLRQFLRRGAHVAPGPRWPDSGNA